MAHALAVRAGGFDGVLDDRRQLDLLYAELDLALADPAHVEKVVNQPDELPDLTLNHVHHRLSRFPVRGSQPQDLQGVADRGERIAQFMGQHREELALAAVGLPQCLFGALTLDDFHLQVLVGLHLPATLRPATDERRRTARNSDGHWRTAA
jgi:hypothetical protein